MDQQQKFRHYLYGAGLALERPFQFTDNVTIHPIDRNLDLSVVEARAESRTVFGFLCALDSNLSFELEVLETSTRPSVKT